MRIQKALAQTGLYSRRQAEELIEQGFVKVNSKRAEIGQSVDPVIDRIMVKGKPLRGDQDVPKVYWLLNKPINYLCSRSSQGDKKTLYDLPAIKKLPFLVQSVGRLDYKTEGLLILSNDGEFIHRASHPSYEIQREYHVLINGRLSGDQLNQIRKGKVELEDGRLENVEIQFVQGKKVVTDEGMVQGSWYFVSLHYGKKRIVRRMFSHFDFKVKRLIRTGFGPLQLDEKLKPGEYRPLTSKEIYSLKRSLNLVSIRSQPSD